MRRRIAKLSTLLAAIGVLASCSHTFVPTAYSGMQLGLKRSRDKHVAVVMLPRNIRPTYTTATDGHSFTFNNIPAFYQTAFRSAFRDSVAEVQFFFSSPPTVPFDAYVYPEARIDASGWINHTCTVRFALTVMDDTGRVVARQQGQTAMTFIAMADAGEACSAALRLSFSSVGGEGMRTLDGI